MAKNAQTAKAEKKSIFWIMQYSTPFLEVYESFKKKLGRKYRFVAPLENRNQIGILSKIIPEIIAADFVIADVSTIGYDANDNERPLYNGNVMFELGVAMAYRKNLIMISSATRKGLPFDISGYHVNEYVDSHLHMEKFIEEIRKILNDENTVYRNPVSDLDHTYTLITNSELEALKAALPTAASNALPVNQSASTFFNEAQTTQQPLSKYEIDVLRYALANPGGCFIAGWVDGKFQIGSHVKNRDDVLNRNGNDDTNAEYEAAVKNLVEKRQYAEQLDRPSRRYKYYKLLASGRKIVKELLSLADSLSSEARKLLVEISKAPLTFGHSVSFVPYDGGREVVVPPVSQYSDEENRERERALLSLLDASSLGAQLLASVGVDKWSLLPLGRVLAYIIENEPSV